MAANMRFALAIHTAGMLALDGKLNVTSETIARSFNTNPVVVRRVISMLAKNGLVTVRKGKGGGAALARPAVDITLADVYKAIEPGPLLPVPRIAGAAARVDSGKPESAVGRSVGPVLTEFFAHAEAGMLKRLDDFTLADFIDAVQHRMNEHQLPPARPVRK